MTKWYGFLLAALVLTGCFPNRMLPPERFLMFHHGQEKILLLSAFPDENDSTGLYISTLLLNLPKGNEQTVSEDPTSVHGGQLAAYVNTFDRHTGQQTSAFYFVDTPCYFDTSDFPVLLATPAADSVQPPFSFSLSRSAVTFAAVSPTDHSTLQYTIDFPKQQPFETLPGGTDLRINGLQPLHARITRVNNEKSGQSSVLSLHTLDNSARLFDKNNGAHFYWIDLTIYGRSGYSVFFEADASGKLKVLHSTFPDALETTVESGMVLKIRKQDSEETFTIHVIEGSRSVPVSTTTFRTMAVNVIQNGLPAGTGIFYQL